VDNSRDFFISVYEAYAAKIYRHCLFRIFSPEKAEELTQEVFLKFWQYVEKKHEIKNAQGLLYRIADHSIIDEKRKRNAESLEALVEEKEFDPSSAEHNDMETRVLYNEAIGELKTLREDERDLFVMRYVDDLDPKEIAEIKNTTANTVSVQLNRITAKLKAKLI
jgi:RNA polymerase sigma-70 factor (ECF subfamily)